MKCVLSLLVVLVAVTADNAPAASSGYSAPASGYGAPTGYAAPDDSYGYDQYSYAPAVEDEGFGLGKLEELLPLFLIVLAAIILGQLLSPLLAQLAVLLVGILPLALNIKAPIVNAILAPFGLTLCDITDPAVPVAVTGRGFSEDFGFSEESGRMMGDAIATFVEAFKSQYM